MGNSNSHQPKVVLDIENNSSTTKRIESEVDIERKSNQSNETVKVINPQKKGRFRYWSSLIALSAISLSATIDAIGDDDKDKYQILALLCSGTTLLIATTVSLMHIFSTTAKYIVGTKLEGLCSYTLMVFWDIGLAVMSKPDNNLAVNEETGYIKNANIYFSSWGAFIVTVIIFAKYIQNIHKINLKAELKRKPRRLTHWFGFMAASLIVSGSSGDIYASTCHSEDRDESYCSVANRSVTLGVCTGFVGLSMSCILVFSSDYAKKLIFLLAELMVSLVMVIANGIAVAHITCESGPGGVINNLFFACWGCLVLSLWIFFNCYDDISSNKEKRQIEQAYYHDMTRQDIAMKVGHMTNGHSQGDQV